MMKMENKLWFPESKSQVQIQVILLASLGMLTSEQSVQLSPLHKTTNNVYLCIYY